MLRSSYTRLLIAILIKVLLIFVTGFVYTIVIASNHLVRNSNSLGVCVFDIDFTLSCKGAYAAVEVCKNAGFDLAINTARNKQDAMQIIYDGTLLEKGFDPYFIDTAMTQIGLDGPFQYKEDWGYKQPKEQIIQNKSYGMRNIANYYNLRTDDIESKRVILFDDFMHNIVQMQPSELDPYAKLNCIRDEQGLCYSIPDTSPRNVAYPRNWKIYSSKWVGYLCTRWDKPEKAAQDAIEAVYSIIYNQ